MARISDLLKPFSSERLVEWFNDLTELWHDTGPIKPGDTSSPKGLTQLIHYKNYVMWHLEEYVRQDGISEKEALEIERKIDLHNIKRLAAIEQIDIWLDAVLKSAGITTADDALTNSETPGSIIDRLSILTLKIFHLREHLNGNEKSEQEKREMAIRLSILEEQHRDLARALDALMLELRQAKKAHKVYRQFKIYNDPNFHPNTLQHY